MFIAYMDEAGYCPNWEQRIEDQPYYALSAVLFPAETLHDIYAGIRGEIDALELQHQTNPLGQGWEIKASQVARGDGPWKYHQEERETVRKILLTAPDRYDGTASIVVVDKSHYLAMRARASSRLTDLYTDSLNWLFERVQWFLRNEQETAIAIYDHAKKRDDELQADSSATFREGSAVNFLSYFNGEPIESRNTIDRILDFTFGRSDNSVGLIVADFFARMAYQYHKDDLPDGCDWFDKMKQSLWRTGSKLKGRGYKAFPYPPAEKLAVIEDEEWMRRSPTRPTEPHRQRLSWTPRNATL